VWLAARLIYIIWGSLGQRDKPPAARQVYLDGATYGINFQDPYNIPPFGGTPFFRRSFWLGPNGGQVNDGYVTIWQLQYPQAQTESAFEVRLENSTARQGYDCPYLSYLMGIYGQAFFQNEWNAKNCDNKPDNRLYNSGMKMGVTVIVTSDLIGLIG